MTLPHFGSMIDGEYKWASIECYTDTSDVPWFVVTSSGSKQMYLTTNIVLALEVFNDRVDELKGLVPPTATEPARELVATGS